MTEANEAFAVIASELEVLAERLGDIAMDELRAAIARGERSRPELERLATRARSGLVRVISLLSRVPGEVDEEY